ncbi:helix-turn-helix transcriptional regulator, partial [Photobacterium iliopiscarium]
TIKQYFVLYHYSMGKSSRIIEDELNCSRTTIEKHLFNIRVKFNCDKSSELRTIFFMRVIDNLIN